MTSVSLEWMDKHDADAAGKLREALEELGEDPAACAVESDLGLNPSRQPSYRAVVAGMILAYGPNTDWEWE